jgi:hypothetical protein
MENDPNHQPDIIYLYIIEKTYLEISILIFKTWDITHASGAPGNIGHRFGQIAVSTNTSGLSASAGGKK